MRRGGMIIALMTAVMLVSFGTQGLLYGQKKGGEDLRKEIVAEIGPEKISYEVLEKAFQKNMNRRDTGLESISKDSIMDFLRLYTNYRLKVLDATDRGFDRDSAVAEDIGQNRKLLAETFYFEKKLMEPWVERMLNYRINEYRIGIMVFSIPSVPNADTLEAYAKARGCLELLKKNVPFEKVAMDSSDDPETGKKGGEVSLWITAGNVQRPIESAFLSLKPGEYYGEVIRTRYAYFLVKLLDVEPRKFVKSQHILLTFNEDEDSSAVYKKAEDLLERLRKGEDFSKLANEYSGDPNTAQKGGVMDEYYSRSTGFEKSNSRLVPQFENALMSLKDNEISDIVTTSYGLHIVKRLGSRDYNREDEVKTLKVIYKKSYYEEDKKNFYDSLFRVYNYRLNKENLDKFISFLDTNKTNLDKEWIKNVPGEFYREILFEFSETKTSFGEFVKMLANNTELRGLGLNESGMLKAINKVTLPMVFKMATKNLERDYPEFAALMQEFHDGILLFKVEQMEVWDKLKIDTLLARQYWDSTKTRYRTKTAYDFNEIYVLSDSTANDLYNQLQSGGDFEDLATKHTQRKGYREKKGYWGEIMDEENAFVKAVKEQNAKEGTILNPVKFEKGYSIIRYNKFLPVRQKTFEEAIPDFAPQVQDMVQKRLLNDWLKRIQEKFVVKIDEKKIQSIISKLNKSKK